MNFYHKKKSPYPQGNYGFQPPGSEVFQYFKATKEFLNNFFMDNEGTVYLIWLKKSWKTLFISRPCVHLYIHQPIHPLTRTINHFEYFKKVAPRPMFWKCRNMFLNSNVTKHKNSIGPHTGSGLADTLRGKKVTLNLVHSHIYQATTPNAHK